MPRLGVHAVLGRSFKTTNCLESVNALVEERCAKVDHWKNSSQRQRWLATALVDIEPRLRKVVGYRHLPKLRTRSPVSSIAWEPSGKGPCRARTIRRRSVRMTPPFRSECG